MTDDRGWQAAVRRAWSHHRRIECGPTGPDREALAAEFSQTLNLAGMPPGNILRPHP